MCSLLERTEIRRDREDVLVGQARDGFFHQLRVDAVTAAVLEQIQLTRDVDRMEPSDSRDVAQAAHRIAVADAARDRFSRTATVHERLAPGYAARRDVRDEA